MKKTLVDVCLLAAGAVGIFWALALLIAGFEVPNAVGMGHSFLSGVATAALDFVENHYGAVISSAVMLLVVFPVLAKVFSRMRRRHWQFGSGAVPG